MGVGELSSATELAVLNGSNKTILGDEVFQFKNAELTGTNTYVLSGLLRGRRGTEWATGTHAAGDRFALIPVERPALTFSELFAARDYKAVTSGATVASAAAQEFTSNGVAYRTYAPVDVGGGCDSDGNVTLNWKRRTRVGGAWLPYVDVPLSETAEEYVVQIWDSTYTQCARIILTLSQSTSYAASDQVADFGVEQQTVYFTVGQLGAAGLGKQARGTAPGVGASDDSPLVPIDPYGT